MKEYLEKVNSHLRWAPNSAMLKGYSPDWAAHVKAGWNYPDFLECVYQSLKKRSLEDILKRTKRDIKKIEENGWAQKENRLSTEDFAKAMRYGQKVLE